MVKPETPTQGYEYYPPHPALARSQLTRHLVAESTCSGKNKYEFSIPPFFLRRPLFYQHFVMRGHVFTSSFFPACCARPSRQTGHTLPPASLLCMRLGFFVQVDCYLLAASKAQESFDSEAVRKKTSSPPCHCASYRTAR